MLSAPLWPLPQQPPGSGAAAGRAPAPGRGEDAAASATTVLSGPSGSSLSAPVLASLPCPPPPSCLVGGGNSTGRGADLCKEVTHARVHTSGCLCEKHSASGNEDGEPRQVSPGLRGAGPLLPWLKSALPSPPLCLEDQRPGSARPGLTSPFLCCQVTLIGEQ